jgi:hypothetical protein
MKRFRKISRKSIEAKTDKADLEEFYKMLLRFEKHHPKFSALNVFNKLYPKADIKF